MDNEFVFCDVNGNENKVDAINMNNSNNVCCYESGNLKAFSASYKEAAGRYTFWGFLPDRAVTSEEFKIELENLRGVRGEPHIRIPKFQFESTMDMVSQLKKSGVVEAFDEYSADFSKGFLLPADWNVYVSDVCQRAKIDFDRPFYFMIWDSREEVSLFVGQVYEPWR